MRRIAQQITAKFFTMTGAELKALRKRIGLSLSQAARQVEVSERTWARWEVSDKVPDGVVKLFEIENGLRESAKK
jgi:DNA-binding transcriptional regulator YiaG